MRALALAADAVATPDLRRLQIAWAFAAVGGWAFMIVLAVHAYAAGGATAVGLAAVARMLPAGAAAPLLGLVADRLSRRDVLIATALARTLLLGAIAGSVALRAPLAAVLALAALFTVLTAAHRPAQAALLPLLAPQERRRAAANALWSGIDNASFVVGALGGGLLATTAGTAAAFAAAGATFIVAAALIARIPRDRPAGRAGAGTLRPVGAAQRPDGAAHPARTAHWGDDALAGLRLVVRDRRLRLLVGVVSASTLLEGMVDVLLVVTALRLLDLGDAGVGWLNAAWGVGGLLGGAAALAFAARERMSVALPAGGLLVGLPLVALAGVPAPAAAVAALVMLGVGYSLVEVAGLTILQRLAHDGVRARAFAVVESSYWLTTGAGAMVAPAVIALAGPRGALALVGAALPTIVLARWAALRRLDPGPGSAVLPPQVIAAEERVLEFV